MSHPDSTPNDLVLRIHLLGGCRILVGTRRIDPSAWHLRKAQALVKLLALAPDHRLHQEHLQELLWPDLDPASAANNLYKALHVARRLLEPDSGHRAHVIQRQGEILVLAPSADLWIDVEAFEAAIAAARGGSEPGGYWHAFELYGGDLLPEDRYEEWAIDRRERLRRTYLASLIEVALLHEHRHEYDRGIEALQHVVDDEPGHEDAHLGLMRLYALAHQRHLALHQYDMLKAAVRRELDAEPSVESTALYREILDGRFPEASASGERDRPPGLAGGQPMSNRPRSNLPSLLTGFVGRERETGDVARLLGEARLVTLTGAGGCGKTRLALEVAARLQDAYPDGVWLVELSGLSDPALVPQSIASVLDVWGEPDRPLIETLASHLRQRRLLLVLDNCEHLIEASAEVVDRMLRACPVLRILATSRQALGIAGEIDWRVPSLTTPAPGVDRSLPELTRYEAVQLFMDRARANRPDFELTAQNAASVAQVCHRLDGMPLAIELAAVRVKALSVDDIANRLDDRFRLLSRGSPTAPKRQQTLRATVDWSYDLLSPAEQTLFARLSVFAGGCALEAVEAICGDDVEGRWSLIPRADVVDVLTQLVDKSLVAAEASAPQAVRYRLLETLRRYGQDRLVTSGGVETLRARHAGYYVALAEQAEAGLSGADQAAWLDRLERDHDNLRSALEWSKSDPRRTEAGLRLAAGIWRFWWLRGYLAEGRNHLDALMASAGEPVASPVRAKALHALGVLAFRQGHYAVARASLEQSLAVAEAAGDRRGIATALRSVGRMAIDQGDPATARRVLDQSIAIDRELGNASGEAWSGSYLGLLAHFQGDGVSARAALEVSLAALRRLDDRWGVAVTLCYLGRVAFDDGDHRMARDLWTQSLGLCRAERYLWCIPYLLEGFSFLAAVEGQPERAVRLAGAAELLHETIGAPHPPVWRADFRLRLTPAIQALDDAAYASAMAEGRAMPLDQAIEYALP